MLGAGFLESVYVEALELEFKKVNVPYEREKKLPVFYDNQSLNKYLKPILSVIIQLSSNSKQPNT